MSVSTAIFVDFVLNTTTNLAYYFFSKQNLIAFPAYDNGSNSSGKYIDFDITLRYTIEYYTR